MDIITDQFQRHVYAKVDMSLEDRVTWLETTFPKKHKPKVQP